MMKLVIAMDSFKGTLSSIEAGECVEAAFQSVFPQVKTEVVCVADGGEGMLEAMMCNLDGKLYTVEVSDPLLRPIKAHYGIAGEIAVIEMAAASGLTLLTEKEHDPYCATTYGTGELIRCALDAGAKKIIVGLGGSATNDGGVGMAQALGIKFKDKYGEELKSGGESLKYLEEIDMTQLDSRIAGCEIIAACDVKKPLYGPDGATYVYGSQKGVSINQAEILDRALRILSEITKKKLGVDFSKREGAGAAGGLGFGMMAFLGARVQSGIDTVLKSADMESKIKGADLLITGEGCIDSQTVNGKTPIGVAAYAKGKIPVIAIAGQVRPGYEAVYGAGIGAVMACVNKIMTLDEVQNAAKEQLYSAAESAARFLKIGNTIHIDR